MANANRTKFDNTVVEWIDSRLPIFTMMQKEYGVFPTPKNFNYFWNFGAIAMVMLVVMIVTGIFLAMSYTPHASMAFESVERIMRDVNNGWLLRYIHMNGASMFFIAVYIHIFRGLYYGSYKQPRELLWIFGVVILLLMMATAFMGYTLPWSQMSGWGATVITSLFSSIPLVGDSLVQFLWGGFSVDNPTLNRFFALHYLLPFVICAVVFLHVWALHVTGSNNPLGIDVKGPQDTLPFNPYYTAKDMFGLSVFLIIYAVLVFFAPLELVHPDHFIPFNPMVTPPHIVPEWYFLPFYAILRAITFDIAIPFTGITLIEAKLGGVLAMFGAIAALLVLPWLDKHPVRSAKFRPLFRIALLVLVVDLCVLTWVGAQVAEQPFVLIGQIATAYYFLFFFAIVPWLSKNEKALPLPNSIHESVMAQKAKKLVLALLAVVVFSAATPAQAAEGVKLPKYDWTFDSPLGTFDRAQLQRGLQVYKEVCAACHSMKLLSYRNLSLLGYSEDQIKAFAAEFTVMDGPNDDGEMFERPARPSDRFRSPFANEQAARAANGGALPPDMSLLARARVGGADYIVALLTGYEPAPAGFQLNPGMNYNKYFTGHQIAMAPPLSNGQVTYADGTEATVGQMAHDVAAFLAWTVEPAQEKRKQLGVSVLLFLGVLSGLMYGVKRAVWKGEH